MHEICVLGTKKSELSNISARNYASEDNFDGAEPTTTAELVDKFNLSTMPEQFLDCAEFDDNTQHVPMWMLSLHLKNSDKQALETDDWINDRIIDAMNELVGAHMNNSCNFQTTLLQQAEGGFPAVTASTVQICMTITIGQP